MALPKTVGFKAEAVDEEGVWCPCTVQDVGNDYVIVSFDGWNADWNRRICDPREIRDRTIPDRKRKRRNLSSTKNPQISKTIREDRLWIGDQETTVEEVDPIRGQILIALPDGEKFFVGPEQLTVSKPELQKARRHNKRPKDTAPKENKQTATDIHEAPPSRDLQAPQSTDPQVPQRIDQQAQPSTDRPTTLSSDFDLQCMF